MEYKFRDLCKTQPPKTFSSTYHRPIPLTNDKPTVHLQSKGRKLLKVIPLFCTAHRLVRITLQLHLHKQAHRVKTSMECPFDGNYLNYIHKINNVLYIKHLT